MPRTVLIVSEQVSLTTDLVVAALADHDVNVFRFDTGDFPQRLDLLARSDARGGWGGVLETPHRTLELESVCGVFYDRPTPFELPESLSAPEAEFAYEEARRGLGGVVLSLDCRWLNHPARAADAEYKPWQLARAGRAGLKAPRTLVTNRPGAARDFARSATDGVICKPLFEEAVSEDGKHKTLYTTRLGSADLADFNGVESTAHLFQDWVPKDHEVRLTVVGVELFAVAIRSTSAKGHLDWRSDYDALEYETLAEVPPEVSAGVQRFLRSFDLSYGAFDFVITPAGDWVFLECNPSGRWGWLYQKLGLPIPGAIAATLAHDDGALRASTR